MRAALHIVSITAMGLLLSPSLLFGAERPAKADATASASTTASSSAALDFGQASPMAYTSPLAGTPRLEVFFGYSYLRAVPTYATGNRLVHMNGGSASVAFNFNRYLGVVGDFGGLSDSQLNLTGPGVANPRIADSQGTAYSYLFGPRFSYRRHERFTPFAQALFGGIHASQVTLDECVGNAAACTPLPSQNAFALTAGAGLDLKLTHHIALRLVQAEYLMTRFANPTTQVKSMQNDIRLSSGLVFRLGGSPPPPPVAYSCSVSQGSVYVGDPITVTGTAMYLNPKRPTTYSWTTNGGRISGTSATATIDTSSAAPGSYVAQGHVTEGLKPGQSADCSAPYTVMAFQPPTISCSASPSTLGPGDSSTITAQGMSPQNRPLSYSYSASEGSISGSTGTATLSTAAATPGTITVTCNVVDDKGQTASATTTVSLVAPPAAVAPATRNLCSIDFGRDRKRPVRVNNEAKACLDDVALTLQRNSDAMVAVVGHRNDGAGDGADAAGLRASNTKAYLVQDKGIDAGRIVVYTGSSDSKTVDMILIPSGAKLDTGNLTPAPAR